MTEKENPHKILELLKLGIKNAFLERLNLTPEAIYCFECKKAYESKKDHSVHQTYKRINYYKYDEQLFVPTQKLLTAFIESIPKKKVYAKDDANTAIDNLHKELENIRKEKLLEIDSNYDIIERNLKELREYLASAKENLEHYFNETVNFYAMNDGNVDRENVIFLMNYELVEGYNTQIQRIFKQVTDYEIAANQFNIRLESQIKDNLNKLKQALTVDIPLAKYDDYFWDINNQADKYLIHNEQYKKTVRDINDTYGSIYQIKEAVNALDAKTRRGVDYLFCQDFFKDEEKRNSPVKGGLNKNAPNDKSICKDSNKLAIDNLQNSLLESNSKNGVKVNDCTIMRRYSGSAMKSGKKRTLSSSKSNSKLTKSRAILTTYSDPQLYLIDSKNFNLSNSILQRFFCYSFFSFYNKNFAPIPERDFTCANKNLLLDYCRKMKMMKEYVKPIAGTNKINIYNPTTKKLTQAEVALKQEEHGYCVFPDGCRSLYINGILYITGGKDPLGNNVSIVNAVDLGKGVIYSRPPMKTSHAYHTIDYLDNYECIIVVGGKDGNNNTEIYDIFTNKWHMLPQLNVARYSSNVVYNFYSGEVYTLFGILDNGRNSDAIEVLELKDITGGWIKIDYGKNALFDLQVNYCKVLQFSPEKFLVYGGNESREIKKKYALYLLEKNEIVKVVDEDDLQQIKLLENNLIIPPSRVPSTNALNAIKRSMSSKNLYTSKLSNTSNTGTRRFDYLSGNSVFK